MRLAAHRTVRLAAASGALVLSLAAPGLTAAAQAPIAIDFEKDCPVLTCTETASSPVDVYTEVTPLSFAGGILHYTAIERMASNGDWVLMELTGILNFNIQPNLTTLSGTVLDGSWAGVDLQGARLVASATRLHDTTFGGTVLILPGTAR